MLAGVLYISYLKYYRQINKKLISLIRLSSQSSEMLQDAKKSASVLWKKLNIENKQPATKRASSYPNANQYQDKNQQFLEEAPTQNEFGLENKDINDFMDEIQKIGVPLQRNQNVKIGYWQQNQRKDSINSNNQQQNESVTYSIVEKLKIDEDSKVTSEAHNLFQSERLKKTDRACRQQRNKISMIKKDLKQLRSDIKHIQHLFFSEKQKIMQQFILFLTKNLTQFLRTQSINKPNIDAIIQHQKQSRKKQEFQQKQRQIKKLMQELQQSRQQNIQLTEKIFDLNQKIYQNDLQTQKKIKALMSFNPRYWEGSQINTQPAQVNFGEHKINSVQNSRSNKEYSQNIEKIGQNLDKLTEKVQKLQKGQQIILSQLSQIDKGRVQLTRQIIKVKAKQKQLIQIQQLMSAKLSRMSKLEYQLKNDQFDRPPDRMKVHADESNQKPRGERIKTQSDNPYNTNTPKLEKQWSPKYKKMTEVFSKNFKTKPQTPKIQANIYRHHNVMQTHSSSNQLGYGFSGLKMNSPKNQSGFHKGFNSSYNQAKSNVIAKANRIQTIQDNQIEKLGARIDQLRNQIKKQINASK